jgi:predicted lipoprotein with Yx(FWY)xxD motif
MTPAPRTGVLAIAACAPLAAFAIGACGGGGSPEAATPAPPKDAGGRAATIGLEADGTLGKVLVDARGRTLYRFEKDAGGRSACASACAAAWPPLREDGTMVAGRGLTRSALGTTARSDGKQVTYRGHPLYRYSGDTKRGDTNGQGLTAFGAAWFAVSGAGDVVTRQGAKPTGGGPY